MANPRLSSQVKNLLGNYEPLLKQVSEDLKASWLSLNPKRESNSDTMYELGKKWGKAEGADALIQELERLSHD